MKKYIFITSEGETSAPNNIFEVNNMQVLGIINDVVSEDEGFEKLIHENEWILEAGYAKGEIQCFELV